jgi:hypothetical protein
MLGEACVVLCTTRLIDSQVNMNTYVGYPSGMRQSLVALPPKPQQLLPLAYYSTW